MDRVGFFFLLGSVDLYRILLVFVWIIIDFIFLKKIEEKIYSGIEYIYILIDCFVCWWV